MNQWLQRGRSYVRQFHPVVWMLVCGEFLESFGRYLVQPFLAIYLYQLTSDLKVVGLVLTAGPLAALAIGLVGGGLTDHWGRRPVLIGSTVLSSLTLLCFGLTTSVPLLALLNMLNVALRSLYRPANFAALADLTPPELRMEAFGLRRVSINLGAAAGPAIGYWMLQISPALGFVAAGSLMLLFGVVVAVGVPETRPQTTQAAPSEQQVAGPGWRSTLSDKALWVYVLCGAGLTGGFAIFNSYLPLTLEQQGRGWVTSLLFALNALMVVVLQLPVNRAVREQRLGLLMLAAGGLFGLAWVGYALEPGVLGLLALTAILTLGELLHAASSNTFLAAIAPPECRGRYEAIANLREVGRAGAPLLAGAVLAGPGFATLFIIIAAIQVVAGAAGLWADVLAGIRTQPTRHVGPSPQPSPASGRGGA